MTDKSKHTSTFSDGSHTYNVNFLWALSEKLPVQFHTVDSLEWQLDEYMWGDSAFNEPLRPRAVLENPGADAPHMQRVQHANMSYPLLLAHHAHLSMPWPEPKPQHTYVIVDGLHRLSRAYLDGDEIVQARVVPLRVLRAARMYDEQVATRKAAAAARPCVFTVKSA
jgi:hypothetical protein